jgi:hypothetical protein
MTIDFKTTAQTIDAALAEYKAVTIEAGDDVALLLGIDAGSLDHGTTTLRDLRAAIGLADARVPSLAVRMHDRTTALFGSTQADAARSLLRSAIRLTHDWGFTAKDEILVGRTAYFAVSHIGHPSPLADRLAWADHVAAYEAAATLGRPVRFYRDFVVRCAVLGLGEALNAEHDPDLSASHVVEAWLGQTRAARNSDPRRES